MELANTLAYYHTSVKSFIAQALMGQKTDPQ